MLNLSVALAIYRRPWLVDAAALTIGQQILAGDKIDLEAKPDTYRVMLFQDNDDDGPSSTKKVNGAVAVFPISGTLYKNDTWCSYGTETIAQKLRAVANDNRVSAIVLDIESGGGCVDAIPCMLQAIEEVKAAGKPIFVHTDYCCSAAYWIASAVDRIYMDNATVSQVGSIGALAQVVETAAGDLEKNGYKIHTIYAKESPDKNGAYRALQSGDESLYTADLSRIVSIFHADIRANRANLKADAPGVLTGGVFYSDLAIDNGLADGVMTLDEVIAATALASATPNQSI